MIRILTFRDRRAGFTAIELMVILVIIAILAGIAAPKMMQLLRRNAVRGACAEVQAAWEQAQVLAQTHFVKDPSRFSTEPHFGVKLWQDESGRAYVAVFHGNSGNESEFLRNGAEKAITELPSSVRLSSVTGTGSASREYGKQTLLWLAQYGTGFPLIDSSPRCVAPIGVETAFVNKADAITSVRFETLNFEEAGDSLADRDEEADGFAYEFGIFSAGPTFIKEYGNE